MRKTIIIFAGTVLLFLVACTNVNNDSEIVGEDAKFMAEIEEAWEYIHNLMAESGEVDLVVNEEISEIIDTLEPIIYLIDQRNTGFNGFSLLDLTTGEYVASYEFDENDTFISDDFFDLGDGFYALPFWDVNWENPRIIIFDERLEVIETIFYDDEVISFLPIGFIKLIDGELIAYGMDLRDAAPSSILNPIKYNFHTGEIKILAEIDESISTMHQFVGEDRIFITDFHANFNTGEMMSRYGILDLTTGLIHFFEREDFRYSHFDFRDTQVLISESSSVGPDLKNQVVVFDAESMSSQIIQLEEEESVWARFSYSGDEIVTINEVASIFRKHDFNGMIISELEIEIPTINAPETFADEESSVTVNWFEIFPISENVYLIYTRVIFAYGALLLEEHHIQFVTLP